MNYNIKFNLDMIIDEYANYVFKIIDNIIGTSLSYQDKEEVVSDTFYLLWKNQDKINTSLKAYLSMIARNAAYDKLRRNHFNAPLDENLGYNFDFDTILDIKMKLGKLSPEELKIFELFYLNGLKVKEIGGILNKSTSAVKIILYRLRKKLKEEC